MLVPLEPKRSNGAQFARLCREATNFISTLLAEKGTASYRVLVQTSDLRGAGTDSDIFITLFGPKGDTGERPLESSANDFERGKLDTFMFTVCAAHILPLYMFERGKLDTFTLCAAYIVRAFHVELVLSSRHPGLEVHACKSRGLQ